MLNKYPGGDELKITVSPTTDWSDRLSYIYSVFLFLTTSSIVSWRLIFEKPIHCMLTADTPGRLVFFVIESNESLKSQTRRFTFRISRKDSKIWGGGLFLGSCAHFRSMDRVLREFVLYQWNLLQRVYAWFAQRYNWECCSCFLLSSMSVLVSH